jgi:hypothetical protein
LLFHPAALKADAGTPGQSALPFGRTPLTHQLKP